MSESGAVSYRRRASAGVSRGTWFESRTMFHVKRWGSRTVLLAAAPLEPDGQSRRPGRRAAALETPYRRFTPARLPDPPTLQSCHRPGLRRRISRPDPRACHQRGLRPDRGRPAQGRLPSRGGANHRAPRSTFTPSASRRRTCREPLSSPPAALPRCRSFWRLAAPLLAPGGQCLFLKGANVQTELTHAATQWHMQVERIPSRTAPDACILRISDLHRVVPTA